MIDGINDTDLDADAMAELLRGEHAHVNLIPMNPVAHTPWTGTPIPRVERVRRAAARRRHRDDDPVQPRHGDRRRVRPARRRARRPADAHRRPAAARAAGRPERRRPARRAQQRAGPGRGGGGVTMTGRRPPGVLIAASILDSDLGALGDEIRRAEDAGADRIHLDVMDGHFVPNITFGWKTIEAVRRVTSIPFDAHLMISRARAAGSTRSSTPAATRSRSTSRSRRRRPRPRPGADPRGRPVGGPVREARHAAGGARRLPRPARHRPRDDRRARVRRPGVHGGRRRGQAGARRAAGSIPTGACEVQVDGGGRAETAEIIGRGGTDVIVAGSALYRAADMAAEVERIRSIATAARGRWRRPPSAAAVRALLQRVSRAEVRVGRARRPGRSARACSCSLGVGHGDDEAAADWLARRICELRIFEDDEGRTNRSLLDVDGEALVVSQFTLYADTRRGRRPGFTDAATAGPGEGPVAARGGRRWRSEGIRDAARRVRRGDGRGARQRRPVHDLARHRRPGAAGLGPTDALGRVPDTAKPVAGSRPASAIGPERLASGRSWSGCDGSACRRAPSRCRRSSRAAS